MTHINKGKPFPLGSSLTSEGVNFSLVATNAEYVEILLFEKEASISPKPILKLDQNHTPGPYWHMVIKQRKPLVALDLSLKNPTSFIKKEMSKINKVKNLSHLLCFINFQIYFLLIT